jgi:hypothetical protein
LNHVDLGKPTSISCRVSDVYPKPKILFTHSSKELNEKNYTEKELPVGQNPYLTTLQSTFNFTPSYTDNGQNLTCVVSSHGSGQEQVIRKPYPINVHGAQIIDNECTPVQYAKAGDQDLKIECLFFLNPRKGVTFWETKEESSSSESNINPAVPSTSVNEQNPSTGVPQSITAAVAAPAIPSGTIKISENDEIHNYVYSLEEQGAGLYKAVLRIKDVRAQDFKEYTFRVGDLTKSITLSKGTKDLSLGQLGSTASSSLFYSHSKISNIIFFVSTLFSCVLIYFL